MFYRGFFVGLDVRAFSENRTGAAVLFLRK